MLDARPRQLFSSESVGEGASVVMVPKFPGKLAQWFMPKLSKTNFRVTLDALGTFVWQNCNGETAVKDIADRLRMKYGEETEPVYERVCEFIRQLHRSRLIELDQKKE